MEESYFIINTYVLIPTVTNLKHYYIRKNGLCW